MFFNTTSAKYHILVYNKILNGIRPQIQVPVVLWPRGVICYFLEKQAEMEKVPLQKEERDINLKLAFFN